MTELKTLTGRTFTSVSEDSELPGLDSNLGPPNYASPTS